MSAFSVIAPQFSDHPWSESEAFGAITWLWVQSEAHNKVPLHLLGGYVLPVIARRQFVLLMEDAKPVGYVSWALFDEECEARYLQSNRGLNANLDWNTGDRMWFIDWFAPFGHSAQLRQLIGSRFFPGGHARSLYHRNSETRSRIMNFHGIAVLPEEARHWETMHPICYPAAKPESDSEKNQASQNNKGISA